MMKTYLLMGVFSVMASCAHKPADMPGKPEGFVLIREYVDAIKSETGDQYQKVQYGWDYDRGVAVKRTYQLDGKPIAVEEHPELTLATSTAELEYAFSLVRKHPVLQAASKRSDATLHGGFAFRFGDGNSPAERFCREKSRCIHVIISAGLAGEVFLGHAIVDLASGSVVDPKFNSDLNKSQSSK